MLESYDCTIDMFLTEYSDGTVQKRGQHMHGHDYPSKQKKGNDGKLVINTPPSLERIHQMLKERVPIEEIDPDLIPISKTESDSESEMDDG